MSACYSKQTAAYLAMKKVNTLENKDSVEANFFYFDSTLENIYWRLTATTRPRLLTSPSEA